MVEAFLRHFMQNGGTSHKDKICNDQDQCVFLIPNATDWYGAKADCEESGGQFLKVVDSDVENRAKRWMITQGGVEVAWIGAMISFLPRPKPPATTTTTTTTLSTTPSKGGWEGRKGRSYIEKRGLYPHFLFNFGFPYTQSNCSALQTFAGKETQHQKLLYAADKWNMRVNRVSGLMTYGKTALRLTPSSAQALLILVRPKLLADSQPEYTSEYLWNKSFKLFLEAVDTLFCHLFRKWQMQ